MPENCSAEKEKKGVKGFVSGILLLSLSTLAVKFIGLAFKLPMLSFLGAEGMGYFNSAYEIYALLCIISTAGLPVALSILVSSAYSIGDRGTVKKIYSAAKWLFFILGTVSALLMLLFSGKIADIIGNPSAAPSIAAISPALLFICLSSAVRGYCQGLGDMLPTAVSQLAEALGKLVLGLLFAKYALDKGYPLQTAAAYAIFGVTVGSFLSFLYLVFAVRKRKKGIGGKCSRTVGSIIYDLSSVALPITLSASVMGLTRIADMMLIMRRLCDVGMTSAEANKIYGSYTTLAVPVFSLIPALIAPVSTALVPRLSSFVQLGDREGQKSTVGDSLRITLLLAVPASLGLCAFSKPVLTLLFPSRAEETATAAPLLAVLGMSVVFTCLITTANAVLQAYRHTAIPIFSMSVGVAVKVASTYLLMGKPSIGVLGAPIGSILCNVTVCLIDLFFVFRESGKLLVSKLFFKPLACAALGIGGGYALFLGLCGGFFLEIDQRVALSVSALLAVFIYFLFLFLVRGVEREDIALLPMGDKILRLSKNKDGNIKTKNKGE